MKRVCLLEQIINQQLRWILKCTENILTVENDIKVEFILWCVPQQHNQQLIQKNELFFLQTFVQGTSCGTEKTQNKTKSFRKVHAVTSKMIPTYSMNQIHIQYGLFIKKNQMCCEYWIKDSRSQSAIHFQWIILLNLYTYKQCVTFSIQKNKN